MGTLPCLSADRWDTQHSETSCSVHVSPNKTCLCPSSTSHHVSCWNTNLCTDSSLQGGWNEVGFHLWPKSWRCRRLCGNLHWFGLGNDFSQWSPSHIVVEDTEIDCFEFLRKWIFCSSWRSCWRNLHQPTLELKKQVKTRLVTDSSSCRAFAQRLGVGKLKHVDTKFLWLQLMIKNSMVAMDSVSTLFNMSDLGTKKLNKARRAFLMFLAGMNIFERKLWDRVWRWFKGLPVELWAKEQRTRIHSFQSLLWRHWPFRLCSRWQLAFLVTRRSITWFWFMTSLSTGVSSWFRMRCFSSLSVSSLATFSTNWSRREREDIKDSALDGRANSVDPEGHPACGWLGPWNL